MDDSQLQLLVSLHESNFRQGTGGEAQTTQAMQLAGLDRSRPLKIAIIGFGTGASAIQLARELDAEITAVDMQPAFLEELQNRAKAHRVADKISDTNRTPVLKYPGDKIILKFILRLRASTFCRWLKWGSPQLPNCSDNCISL